MQEARVQVETQEPISREIRAYWFTLLILANTMRAI